MSVFAQDVRYSHRRDNRNDQPHTERHTYAAIDYSVLEDKDAFHEVAERVRLYMLKALEDVGAPINVWRVGHVSGTVSVPIETVRGAEVVDRHIFDLRTRCSVETPPFTSDRED